MIEERPEDVYSPNLDLLIGNSFESEAIPVNYQNEISFGLKQSKVPHYDSCDSDDYADSDN